MEQTNSKNECPSCKGQLNYEGCFQRYYNGFRFDQYRCVSCGKVVEIRIDKSIEEIFPIIRNISIDILEEGEKIPRRYSKSFSGSILFCCSNPKCTKPGIYIEPILQEMVEKRQAHKVIRKSCDGFEPSPQWRRKKPCDKNFQITIDLIFDNKKSEDK